MSRFSVDKKCLLDVATAWKLLVASQEFERVENRSILVAGKLAITLNSAAPVSIAPERTSHVVLVVQRQLTRHRSPWQFLTYMATAILYMIRLVISQLGD